MATNWVIWHWEDESGRGELLYEVEWAGLDEIVVKTYNGGFEKRLYCECDFVTEEQAMLWRLENR